MPERMKGKEEIREKEGISNKKKTSKGVDREGKCGERSGRRIKEKEKVIQSV